MTEAVIEIQNLSLSIGGNRILRNVSLNVAAGQSISVIGPNGAGKTTLLRCIDKIATGIEGTIKVYGRNIKKYHQKELARAISYVPQSNGCNLPFTVREFVMMGRYPHLSPFSTITTKDEQVVNDALELTETMQFAERQMATLSGGERQSVLIAGALTQEAEIMLLDEPTTFLDYKHQADIEELLRRINKERGVTTVSVTHDINMAAMFSETIIALKAGEVIFSGTGDELMNNETLRAIYDRNFLFTNHPQTGQRIVVPQEIRQ
ncbi:MAG: ATP-binding cassette domain-containing protein [Planctomycetes bacterium]|nr:ATP-binding cassette domain-containing protein [Planctomycetota bacterium]